MLLHRLDIHPVIVLELKLEIIALVTLHPDLNILFRDARLIYNLSDLQKTLIIASFDHIPKSADFVPLENLLNIFVSNARLGCSGMPWRALK